MVGCTARRRVFPTQHIPLTDCPYETDNSFFTISPTARTRTRSNDATRIPSGDEKTPKSPRRITRRRCARRVMSYRKASRLCLKWRRKGGVGGGCRRVIGQRHRRRRTRFAQPPDPSR